MTASVRRTTTPAGDPAWQVSDYATVRRLLADHRLGRTHPEPENASRYSEAVIFGRPQPPSPTEAADHARMRRLLGALLDGLEARHPPVDLHEAVSFPLPALVICELLGVPYVDRDRFRRWSADAADMTDQVRSLGGLGALWQYMNDLVAAKLTDPGADDVLSTLLTAHRADPSGFKLDQVAMLGAGLLFAGHETTVAAIDTGVVQLATHPGQRDALRADPALLGPAVEEILRSALPTSAAAVPDDRGHGLPRWANADIEVGGVLIPAGDLVLLGLQQANHDAGLVGDRPDFDITRWPNPHLAFGHGPHFCIGAPLARLELRVLFATLLDWFPGFALAVPVDELQPRTDTLTGGLATLPVRW